MWTRWKIRACVSSEHLARFILQGTTKNARDDGMGTSQRQRQRQQQKMKKKKKKQHTDITAYCVRTSSHQFLPSLIRKSSNIGIIIGTIVGGLVSTPRPSYRRWVRNLPLHPSREADSASVASSIIFPRGCVPAMAKVSGRTGQKRRNLYHMWR